MTYLDTDFLIHFLVNQDKEKHRFVTKKLKPLVDNGLCFISFLTLQEVVFVLSKLKYDTFEIIEKVEQIEKLSHYNYAKKEFRRAK